MGFSFPFSAIVGQDDMKRALLIAAVDPAIGGVMVFGDRGTGKSTAARALASLLPEVPVVAGCRFNCEGPAGSAACIPGCGAGAPGRMTKVPVPFIDLPLGATEDRVVGALDIEAALNRGVKAFEPGLLARAHRGFLYIDEINLLEDHIVDLLLDVAQSGENIVERDGLSVRHPARFVIVGSGNPEEGELRPQLLDRFGLSVEVRTPTDLAQRIEVVRRRDAFERDRAGFVAQWAGADRKVARTILAARRALATVEVPDVVLTLAARLCMGVGTDGLRGELTLMRAARALAALERRRVVGAEQLQRVAAMSLRHRLRRNPLDETGSDARIARAVAEALAA
jgi:magnesium chelatase subunit I